MDNLFKSLYFSSQISDQRVVHAILNVSKLSFPCKRLSYRKYGSINVEQFKEDISNSETVCERTSYVDGLVFR